MFTVCGDPVSEPTGMMNMRLAEKLAQERRARMAAAEMAVGPALDIILEEMPLAAVDRKWGKRKGWAKKHLQAALDLYDPLAAPSNRHE